MICKIRKISVTLSQINRKGDEFHFMLPKICFFQVHRILMQNKLLIVYYYIKSAQTIGKSDLVLNFFLRFHIKPDGFFRCTESICLRRSEGRKNVFPQSLHLWFL